MARFNAWSTDVGSFNSFFQLFSALFPVINPPGMALLFCADTKGEPIGGHTAKRIALYSSWWSAYPTCREIYSRFFWDFDIGVVGGRRNGVGVPAGGFE
jgi:hypothetical protein